MTTWIRRKTFLLSFCFFSSLISCLTTLADCLLVGLPREVVVLEIDGRIIDFVNDAAKKHNLKLRGCRYDIRVPLTADFAKNFDVFVCDPTVRFTSPV